MATARKNPSLRELPVIAGMLRASGETIAGPRTCDWFDVFVDDRGNLVALLLNVGASAETPADFLATVTGKLRTALTRFASFHTVVNELEIELESCPGVEVGLVVLRASQRDAKVELLNAGMPAIANAGPGGRLDLYPALSSAVGHRVGEVHPYELVPLLWGSSWLAVSDGMLNGAKDTESVSALCAEFDLVGDGLRLASAPRDELCDTIERALVRTRVGSSTEDATCVLLGADSAARFRSGIADVQ